MPAQHSQQVEQLLINKTNAIYDVHGAITSAAKDAHESFLAASSTHKALHNADRSIGMDMTTRSGGVDAATKELKEAGRFVGKLVPKLNLVEAKKNLESASMSLHAVDNSLTSILRNSADLTEKAIADVKLASDAASRLIQANVTAKGSLATADRTIMTAGGDGDSTRLVAAKTNVDHAIRDAKNIEAMTKELDTEINSMQRILDNQKTVGPPTELKQAMLRVKVGLVDAERSLQLLNAVDRPRTEWTALKLHLSEAQKALRDYQASKETTIASDVLVNKLIQNAIKITDDTLKEADWLSRKTISLIFKHFLFRACADRQQIHRPCWFDGARVAVN